jgi:hypothetical protein
MRKFSSLTVGLILGLALGIGSSSSAADAVKKLFLYSAISFNSGQVSCTAGYTTASAGASMTAVQNSAQRQAREHFPQKDGWSDPRVHVEAMSAPR